MEKQERQCKKGGKTCRFVGWMNGRNILFAHRSSKYKRVDSSRIPFSCTCATSSFFFIFALPCSLLNCVLAVLSCPFCAFCDYGRCCLFLGKISPDCLLTIEVAGSCVSNCPFSCISQHLSSCHCSDDALGVNTKSIERRTTAPSRKGQS